MQFAKHAVMTCAATLTLAMLGAGCDDSGPTADEPPPLPEPVAEDFPSADPAAAPQGQGGALDNRAEPRPVPEHPELRGEAPPTQAGEPVELAPPGQPAAPEEGQQLDPQGGQAPPSGFGN